MLLIICWNTNSLIICFCSIHCFSKPFCLIPALRFSLGLVFHVNFLYPELKADWKAVHVLRYNHNRVYLKPVDFSRIASLPECSCTTGIYLSHPDLLQFQTSKLFPSCPHGRAVNECSWVERGKKKVCISCISLATSHSAHFHHLPLSFSFCWQSKIHRLPSHLF